MPAVLLVGLLVFIVVFLLALVVIPRVGSKEVQEWADSYGVPADGPNRELIERYLTRTRRIRMLWAVAGLLFGGSFVRLFFAKPQPWASGAVLALAGYLLGAFIAERTLPPTGRGGTPSAVLSPRTLRAYVPRYAIVALVCLPLALVVLVPVYAGISPPPRAGLAPVPTLVGACVVGVLFAISVGQTMRGVIRRPQAGTSADLVAVDDGFRSSSLHALAGAGVALELLLIAFELSQIQGALSFRNESSDWAAVLALFAAAMSIASWVVLGHPRSWRTRRPLLEGQLG